MPTKAERRALMENTGNAEFLGNKNQKYMNWLTKNYEKADRHTRALIDKAVEDLKADVTQLHKAGLKKFFDDDFIASTWDDFRNNAGFTAATRAAKLSTQQAFFIHAYTCEAPLYQELNAWLFNEVKPTTYTRSQLLSMKRMFSNALKKMPKHEGIVYRHIEYLNKNTLQQYKPGAVIKWDGFSSASTKDITAFSDRKFTFIIHSKTSRKIESLSAISTEKETLFLPGKFKIVRRKKQGENYFFELLEL